jgi:predicted AAA+ superfamily ATPase
MELVTREDLRDLSRVSSWRGPADLVELLRERVGKPTNYGNLAQNLGISPPTSKAWVELLEELYLVFLLPPFSSRCVAVRFKTGEVAGSGQQPAHLRYK